MRRSEVHRFDRLHQVRVVEEQRCRQALTAANSALRAAAAMRASALADLAQRPDDGVRDLAVFHSEVRLAQLRSERLAAADEAVHQAEAFVVSAHRSWTLAARRVQGLDRLVERRREAMTQQELVSEANEAQDLFLARRAMEQR